MDLAHPNGSPCTAIGSQQGPREKGLGIHLEVGPQYLCIWLAERSCPPATSKTTLAFSLRCCLLLLSIYVGRGAC